MKNEIKIAIFGLSLNVLDGIKQKVLSMFAGHNVNIHWANIAEPQLDVLLVNDMFFASPTIQNLVKNQNVPYLRLVSGNVEGGVVQDDKLYLPFLATTDVKQWFNHALLYGREVPKSNVNAHQESQAPSFNSNVLNEFFNERNGNMQVFDSNGNLAIINANTEQVLLDVGRKSKSTNTTLNYTYATMQNMVQAKNNIHAVDVRAWLWNLLWSSPALVSDTTHKNYQMSYWPQPDPSLDRRDILKISACFEKGASIKQVAEKLQISEDRVRKFVAVAYPIHALKEIDEKEAKLVSTQDNEPKQEGALKGFFGKLRKRLGL